MGWRLVLSPASPSNAKACSAMGQNWGSEAGCSEKWIEKLQHRERDGSDLEIRMTMMIKPFDVYVTPSVHGAQTLVLGNEMTFQKYQRKRLGMQATWHPRILNSSLSVVPVLERQRDRDRRGQRAREIHRDRETTCDNKINEGYLGEGWEIARGGQRCQTRAVETMDNWE